MENINNLDKPDSNYIHWFKIAYGIDYTDNNTGIYEKTINIIRKNSLPGSGFDDTLINYCYNMIHYYETRIKDVDKLIKKMSIGSNLEFSSDLAIIDQQKNGIENIIANEDSLNSIDDKTKNESIKKYKNQIGNHSSDVMNKDYENRKRTIRYVLLINEYKENIKKIKKELSDYKIAPIEAVTGDLHSDVNIDDEYVDDDLSDEEFIKAFLNNLNKKGGSVFNSKYTRYNNSNNSKSNKTKKNRMTGGTIHDDIKQLIEVNMELKTKGSILALDPVFKTAYFSLLYTINFIKKYNLKLTAYQLHNYLREDLYTCLSICEKYSKDIKYNYIKNNYTNGKQLKLNGGSLKVSMFRNDAAANENSFIIIDTKVNDGDTYQARRYNKKTGTYDDGTVNINDLIINNNDFDDYIKNDDDFKEKGIIFWDKIPDEYKTFTNTPVKNELSSFSNINKETENIILNIGDIDYGNIGKLRKMFSDFLEKISISKNTETINNTPTIDSNINNNGQNVNTDYNESLDNNYKQELNLPDMPINDVQNFIDNKLKEKEELTKINKTINDIDTQLNNTSNEYQNIINDFNENALKYNKNMIDLQKMLDDNNLIIESEKETKEKAMNEQIKLNEETQQNTIDLENILINDDNDLKLYFNKTDLLNETEVTDENKFELKMANLYIKRQLYNFAKVCDELDSVPEWRLKLVNLIFSYMSGFLFSPNKNPSTGKNDPLQNKPGYEYFNIILKGNPGIGKSFTSEKIGLALMYSGLLTKGKLIPIKKPEIIGQYTGQTAPKVYNELTRAMGNIVFLDEAYSIAGKMDETKGTYNEFGQEALDAITDFTSEHIGLFGIVAAGYSYEMQKQFLDVNIGLPRRFPTVLTLHRYNMNSYWKIIKSSLINISPKSQVNRYHRACFEILNIMFSNSPPPNPLLKLSDDFNDLFNSLKVEDMVLKAINVNLKLQNNTYPFMSLKHNSSLNGLTSRDVNFMPFDKFISDKQLHNDEYNQTTIAYLKSYFVYLYTGLINGDPFRSQADNITKFTETILSDKIFNGGKVFDRLLEEDTMTNFAWIEYIYFTLYFKKNPNNVSLNNINYEFIGRSDELTDKIKTKMGNILKNRNEIKPKLIKKLNEMNEMNVSDKNLVKRPFNINKLNDNADNEHKRRNIQSSEKSHLPTNKNGITKINGGGEPELNFYINIENIGDIKDLSERVIIIHTKLYKFKSGEDDKEKLKAEINELNDLLSNFKNNNNNNNNYDVDTIYMYVILSAYVTACEEYIKPEGAFKTEGWWFYDKEHFLKIVKVLEIKDILRKYNDNFKTGVNVSDNEENNISKQPSTELTSQPTSEPSTVSKEQNHEGQNPQVYDDMWPLQGGQKLKGGKIKTLRVLYKTNSGRHTRYARR